MKLSGTWQWRHRLTASGMMLLALGCSSTLPKEDEFERPPPAYFPGPEPAGPLAELSRSVRQGHEPEQSGFLVLENPEEALEWRLALADSAQSTLDLAYFFWLVDEAGVLLSERVMAAADRGVKVRVLIDDLRFEGGDKDIAALSLHPNIAIKIFNPWVTRAGVGRAFEWMLHTRDINQRLHNKIFSADGHAAIVGGRNISNEYFGLGKKFNVIDLDLLAVGPIVDEVNEAFDFYWNHPKSFPGEALDLDVTEEDLEELRETSRRELEEFAPNLTAFDIEPRDWTDWFETLPERLHFGPSKVIYDRPTETESRPTHVIDSLADLAQDLEHDLLISSAFFVPETIDLEAFESFVDNGVRVRILTNSLASNKNTISNSGYKPWRKRLLKAGVELWELQVHAEEEDFYSTDPVDAKFLGLHSKVIVVDHDIVFVGSLNLDPRSIYINTEMGLLVENPELAQEVAATVERSMTPENGWRVYLGDKGHLRWESSQGDVGRQPARRATQRFQDWFYGLLPIKKHL